nr:DUF4279 domain-containing protein [Heyndrickxia camelliae]
MPSRSTVCYRKETSWDIGKRGYQDSLDVDDQLKRIIGKLHNKISVINEIKRIIHWSVNSLSLLTLKRKIPLVYI